MENRSSWSFSFEVEKILAAAVSREAYHRERFSYWTTQHARDEALLKEKGVEFRDQPVTGGYNMQVMVDPEMVQRVKECKAKLKEHEGRAKEYARWAICLKHETVALLQLTHEDVEYFALEETTP